jgi:chromosome segregation ATPase
MAGGRSTREGARGLAEQRRSTEGAAEPTVDGGDDAAADGVTAQMLAAKESTIRLLETQKRSLETEVAQLRVDVDHEKSARLQLDRARLEWEETKSGLTVEGENIASRVAELERKCRSREEQARIKQEELDAAEEQLEQTRVKNARQ